MSDDEDETPPPPPVLRLRRKKATAATKKPKGADARVLEWKPKTEDVDAVVTALEEAVEVAKEAGCTTAILLLISKDSVIPTIVMPDEADLSVVVGELEALKMSLVLEILDGRDEDDEDDDGPSAGGG